MGKRSAPTSPNVPAVVKRLLTTRPNPLDPYRSAAAETWVAIGNCATTIGMIVVAIKLFELALLHAPNSVDALVGWSYSLRMNDIAANETVGSQTAIQRLTKAADHHRDLTNSASFFRELTECYLLVGLNDQAHQLILLALQLTPNDPALCLLLAQTLIRAGARPQAAAQLTHCLLLLPLLLAEFSKTDIETARSAHAELAAIAAADGNIDLSIAELTATLLLPPPPLARADEHIALWCAFATAKERANRIPEALEACERAEVAVGPLPRILITHAYLLLLSDNRDNAEKAVDLLTKVVEAEPAELRDHKNKDDDNQPGDFLPWYLLGKAYTVLDLPRAAYDSYQIALRRASSLPITWLAVGKLYLELKQLPDALAAYSQALRLQLNENLLGTAAAWEGLSCVYERCDDQLGDAADACSRAAMCYRNFSDTETAEYFETRSKKLQAAAAGNGPVPPLTQPLGVPSYFLRDLVTLLPSERIAFVQGFGKTGANGDVKRESASAAAQTPNGTVATATPAPGPELAARDKPFPPYGPHSYLEPPYGAPPHANRPYEQQALLAIPPPMAGQPQHYANSPAQLPAPHAPDRTPQQMYQLSQPFKPDSKLPAQMQQQLPPPGARHWSPQDHLPHQPPHMYQGPLPPQGQYPPPPNGMMTPPPMPQAVGQGPHRSPLTHAHVMGEAYPMATHPGYVYGQYVPVHGGMLTHVQPYAGTNWRQ